jgi:hypothetical protein
VVNISALAADDTLDNWSVLQYGNLCKPLHLFSKRHYRGERIVWRFLIGRRHAFILLLATNHRTIQGTKSDDYQTIVGNRMRRKHELEVLKAEVFAD